MKRNDLFNNNHSRQTSSIPYLLPKSGTVYTELSTNQIVGEPLNPEDKESFSMKTTSKHQKNGRRKNNFELFRSQQDHSKTERGFE